MNRDLPAWSEAEVAVLTAGPPAMSVVDVFNPDNPQFTVIKRGFLVVLPSMNFMLLGIGIVTRAERTAR